MGEKVRQWGACGWRSWVMPQGRSLGRRGVGWLQSTQLQRPAGLRAEGPQAGAQAAHTLTLSESLLPAASPREVGGSIELGDLGGSRGHRVGSTARPRAS